MKCASFNVFQGEVHSVAAGTTSMSVLLQFDVRVEIIFRSILNSTMEHYWSFEPC